MFLSDVSIKRPVFATMMMVALIVLGVTSYKRLAVDEYPDVTYPIISVNVSYPGASPEVVEREVARPIETALNTVDGLYELTSTSSEGSANIRLQFKLGVEPTKMQPEVSAKVGRIRRQLPRDIQEPVISRYDPNDQPILTEAAETFVIALVDDASDARRHAKAGSIHYTVEVLHADGTAATAGPFSVEVQRRGLPRRSR